MHNALEINRRFEGSWEVISQKAEQMQSRQNDSERALRKLKRCLKWCTAYSILQSHCSEIIAPYHQEPALIIKWFWIEYGADHFASDHPPTPKEFFDWYCHSGTIKKESQMENGLTF